MRFPLAPLMEAAGIETMLDLRRIFPMNGTAYRSVLDEGLSEVQADRWAVKLGLVPWLVWSDWAHRPCDAEDCDVTFMPAQAHQRFCSPNCSSRQRRRDRYRSDPEYRQQRRENARRYYEDCREYVRKRQQDNRSAHSSPVSHSRDRLSA